MKRKRENIKEGKKKSSMNIPNEETKKAIEDALNGIDMEQVYDIDSLIDKLQRN
ncbi:MAG: hypothetical protein GYB37_14410 [Algicola sp.]|nr:hypothetical protein [Algicola sp.]